MISPPRYVSANKQSCKKISLLQTAGLDHAAIRSADQPGSPERKGQIPMSFDQVQTLIIGGGQAGLAMSHMLSRRGCPHRVVERGRIAERWRSERWEGLCFQFPNWSVQLPDYPLANDDPDGFRQDDRRLCVRLCGLH